MFTLNITSNAKKYQIFLIPFLKGFIGYNTLILDFRWEGIKKKRVWVTHQKWVTQLTNSLTN
jgi:hypothetical protein